MKKKRFSVEQIVTILKQAELGMPVAELIRRVGISEQTFYRWKKQNLGLEVDEVRSPSKARFNSALFCQTQQNHGNWMPGGYLTVSSNASAPVQESCGRSCG